MWGNMEEVDVLTILVNYRKVTIQGFAQLIPNSELYSDIR
jgi:hypothetical protein